MPRKLMFGSQGQDVADLQSKLNERPPTNYPLLVVDGIFGLKTLARVKEFQSANTLVMDGIVGAKTWDALLSAAPAVEIPPLSHRCGNGDEGNAIVANTVTQLVLSTLGPTAHSAAVTPGMGFVDDNFSFGKTPSKSSGSASPIRSLTSSQIADARAVYGSSIDFSKVFISSVSGLNKRPFTVAIGVGSMAIQVMNCGTFFPTPSTLIHELAHVWQSQHSYNPKRYMTAAVLCQAAAVKANHSAASSDPSVVVHKDHPVDYPFSAYAFFPKVRLGLYGAEQMAQACEIGDKGIRAYVSSIPANTVDPENEASLNLCTYADRRSKGVLT